MADLNNLVQVLSEKQHKLERELKEFVGIQQDLKNLAESEFQEQLLEQKGKLEGLEDFFDFVNTVKRNERMIKSCLSAFMAVKNISHFRITEEEEKPKEKAKA